MSVLRHRIVIATLATTAFLLGRKMPAQEVLPKIVVVLGAPGEPEFAEQFRSTAASIENALGKPIILIDGTQLEVEGQESDRARLLKVLDDPKPEQPLWLFLIGHGTYQNGVAKFNLRGPDITPAELKTALHGWSGPQLIVVAASGSAPFLQSLSRENRILITATKSGAEVNLSRFGTCFASALEDPSTDMDHDDSISVLEAFLSASYRVQQFYKEQARLATEQALLDDNGDGKGTPATFFRGLRAQQQATGAPPVDGQVARKMILVSATRDQSLRPEQIIARDRIEREIELLRVQKEHLSEEEYYRQLEELFAELVEVLQIRTPK